jgi:hypothetical protein
MGMEGIMEWIDVKDRLPELHRRVLLFRSEFDPYIGCLDTDGHWYINGSLLYQPTHWMPLPEPPKED